MNIKARLKRWFKLRFAIVYPFGLFVLIFCAPSPDSFKAGIWFVFCGLIIRLWANAYAIKLDKLTTSGPYAFLRHPLYLGTLLISIGFVIMLRTSYIGLLFIIVMVVTYYNTMKKEDKMLEDKFKNAYLDYKKRVPAIIPTVIQYRDGEKWSFSIKRLIKNHEYKLFLWVIIIIIVFSLKMNLVVLKDTMDRKNWGLVIFALSLGIIDLIGEAIKAHNKKLNR